MIKKFWVVIPSFFCLSSLTFAESPDTYPSKPCKPTKAVTPSARTCSELNGAYVTGEFIYWKAREDEMIFSAFVDITSTPSRTERSFRPIELEFQYDPGFKLGLGGDLPFDGWDLYLNWTHFHTVPTISKSSNQANIVSYDVAASETLLFGARRMKQSWNLMFNSLDFDWGRRFYLSRTLTVRPSFGGKAAWVHQKLRSFLLDTESIVGGIPGNTESFATRNNFWGIGPYLAFEGKWTFGYGIGLYGEISGAILWGKFEQISAIRNNGLQQTQQGQTLASFEGNFQFETHRVRPTTQAFIGLDWEWCFIPKWLSLNLRAGYETQIFWSQFIGAFQGFEESDLTFEGFTFMGRIDF